MQSQASKVEIGAVLADTASIYRGNAAVLLGSAVAVFVIVGLLQAALYSEGGILLVSVASVKRTSSTSLTTKPVYSVVPIKGSARAAAALSADPATSTPAG